MRKWWILVALGGCGAEPVVLPSADAGVLALDAAVALDAAEPVCEPPALPGGLVVREGGRIMLPLALELEPPIGWRTVNTGTETAIRVPYGVEGAHAIVVRYTCPNGERREAAIEVAVSRLGFVALPAWTDGVDGPSAREHPLLMIDGDRLLLFGGFAFRPRQFTLVADLWSYDLVSQTWSPLPAMAAPALASGRWARGPNAREVVMFGGSDARFEARLEAHRMPLEGSTVWSPIALNAGAGALPSQLGSFIYDAPRERYVSACGITSDSPHCQVAALDASGGAYEVLEPAGDAPSPRYGFFAAHDLENQRLVIFSGAQAPRANSAVNPAGDVWALELDEQPVRWTKLLSEDPLVRGRRNGCSAFDPIGQRMFVWGGTPDGRTTEQGLFAFDLQAGVESMMRVEITPPKPASSSCSAVYDPARRRILFGFGNNSTAIFADLVALEL